MATAHPLEWSLRYTVLKPPPTFPGLTLTFLRPATRLPPTTLSWPWGVCPLSSLTSPLMWTRPPHQHTPLWPQSLNRFPTALILSANVIKRSTPKRAGLGRSPCPCPCSYKVTPGDGQYGSSSHQTTSIWLCGFSVSYWNRHLYCSFSYYIPQICILSTTFK